MRILALEPYYGGSHRAFIDGWIRHSRHDWTLLTLPAHKWKWRMRHSAVTFADQVQEQFRAGKVWDLVLATDMVNLAEFKGLVPPAIANLPVVAYFHENQLTYPVQVAHERDLHFAFSNVVSCLAADAIWFNSAYHRDTFLEAVESLLNRMPDYQCPGTAAEIKARAQVCSPGIEPIEWQPRTQKGPLHLVWCARWEHDKNPELLFSALRILKRHVLDFQLSVLGQKFSQIPACFADARREFVDNVVNWGYLEGRDQYLQALAKADVVVSTAAHEFFGLAVIESISCGAYPMLPHRLAYPELLASDNFDSSHYFYNGTPEDLADRLAQLIARHDRAAIWPDDPKVLSDWVNRYSLTSLVPQYDAALETIKPKRH